MPCLINGTHPAFAQLRDQLIALARLCNPIHRGEKIDTEGENAVTDATVFSIE